MSFDARPLAPLIRRILTAPGTDLSTVSAKSVRRRLCADGAPPALSEEQVKAHKKAIDAVIAEVFEAVAAAAGGVGAADGGAEETVEEGAEEREGSGSKRGLSEEEYGEDGEEADAPPPKKKAKKARGGAGLTDEELARRIESELNARARPTRGAAAAGGASGAKRGKRGGVKSAARVDDGGSDEEGGKRKRKKKEKGEAGGGGAKGGFGKEYALSAPLAAVLNVDKLSRPQVVKQLWVYIKGNELQNPANKKEILCDAHLRAVFGADKIDMFKMNKVLGQHLHEPEG